MLTKNQIEAFEQKGFNYWTDGVNEWMYPDPPGLELEYYKTGNVSALLRGEEISDRQAIELRAGRCLVCVANGKLHCNGNVWALHADAIKRLYDEVMATVQPEEERTIKRIAYADYKFRYSDCEKDKDFSRAWV